MKTPDQESFALYNSEPGPFSQIESNEAFSMPKDASLKMKDAMCIFSQF